MYISKHTLSNQKVFKSDITRLNAGSLAEALQYSPTTAEEVDHIQVLRAQQSIDSSHHCIINQFVIYSILASVHTLPLL